MKKILFGFVIILSVFLLSCTETTEIEYNFEVEVSFDYETLDILSSQYPTPSVEGSVSDTFILYQVRTLTSDYGTIPYESAFLEEPGVFASMLRDIFNVINTKENVFQNQFFYSVILGEPMPQYSFYLQKGETEIICDFYYYESTNETSFQISYYEETILFFYDFGNEFYSQYPVIIDWSKYSVHNWFQNINDNLNKILRIDYFSWFLLMLWKQL